MLKQETMRIEGEIGDSQTAKAFAINHYSSLFAQRLEEMLYERQTRVEEKLRHLRRNLGNLNLSEEKIFEICEKIEDLQNSRMIEAFSISDSFDLIAKSDIGNLIHVADCKSSVNISVEQSDSNETPKESNSVYSLVRAWTFEVEYENGYFHWRAFSTRFIRNKVSNSNFLEKNARREKPEDQYPRGIDKDSLSYFQNCPLPPGNMATVSNVATQTKSDKLMNGCLVSITLNPTGIEQQIGGIKWKNTKKRLTIASESYGRFLITHHVSLKCYLRNYLGFSTSIKNSQKKHFKTSLVSKHQLPCKIIQQLSPSFAFCLHSSDYEKSTNKVIYKGDLN